MGHYIMKVENLSYSYEKKYHALKCVNMNIRKNCITAVLGSNGAGKSTLFLNLNGILKPTEGRVFYNDKQISYKKKDLIELRKNLGLVFQDPDNQLFSNSVYEDISFGPMNLGLDLSVVRKRVEYAIEKTGIFEIRDKPTHMLSFGQKKRVAIAGIIAMEPKVIVLDEPTAGLDPAGVSEIMKFLRQLKEELGLSILIATHNIDLVPIYCDYVYVMHKGKVKLKGKPTEVFSNVDEFRKCNLRLPRLGHLMEILKKKDNINIDLNAVTISKARKEFLRLLKKKEGNIND